MNKYDHKKTHCAVCGAREKKQNLVLHHIKSKKRGGTDDPENLVTLCKGCHRAVHSIRRHQNKNISNKGWIMFEKLVKNCKTRMQMGGFGRY